MLDKRYHLPHNSVRIDEFLHMLGCVDLSKDYYYYDDLRIHFFRSQIVDKKLSLFHPAYHRNLKNHTSEYIREIYLGVCNNPTEENIKELFDCQYTSKKTFKKVWNETVRDYTEFFAFLGLLTTYYKGRSGGDKKHYVTQRLKDFRSNKISLEELLLEFRYRNSSKDYETIDMYSITVRPFCVALKALSYYFSKGFSMIQSNVLSAIVTYAHDENIDNLLLLFNDPTLPIDRYENLFSVSDNWTFNQIKKELGRASVFLKPYLVKMGYVSCDHRARYVTKGIKEIDEKVFSKKAVFCNDKIGNVKLTPVIGKILFILYSASKQHLKTIKISDLFDSNINEEDRTFLLRELKNLECLKSFDDSTAELEDFVNQFSINPYTEFFDIDDCNYVQNIRQYLYESDEMIIKSRNSEFENEMNLLKPIALGSDGNLYEKALYTIMKSHLPFKTIWYGSNYAAKRLSDIVSRVKIVDENGVKKSILIIIECKAGNAIKSFDERKEIPDIVNTLQKEKDRGTPIDGVWYWVVDSNSLPNSDEHGGYRSNNESKSFAEKLNDIQFSVSELTRAPTIVTAFSFEAIRNYLAYLVDKIGSLEDTAISKLDAPHFWRWSKKFMNLQYVMVHKELRLNV